MRKTKRTALLQQCTLPEKNKYFFGAMSGVFLTVWDTAARDASPVLRTTSGGYPHITLVYTGDAINSRVLYISASDLVAGFVFDTVTLTHAFVHSFDKDGRTRYDVLLGLDAAIDQKVRDARAFFEKETGISFDNVPHVTHGIYDTPEAAEAARAAVAAHLPRAVLITGFTVE
jgi:hypothetical protein